MPTQLRILHVLRAPVGGLFRHVLDLAAAQAHMGLEVGIVCAETGNRLTEEKLNAARPHLALGLHRLPIGRELGLGDIKAWRRVSVLARQLNADVLHGHGAKGGAYARLAARSLRRSHPEITCFYTPHGGSLNFSANSLSGRFYMSLERRLESASDGIIFESAYARDRYTAHIGVPRVPVKVVPNGLLRTDFTIVRAHADATDFLFVGELRHLKGVDVALDALHRMALHQPATLTIVGDGPDRALFEGQVVALGLQDQVKFTGALPIADALPRGRVMLVPSRAESFPYIVLEAAAAGVPMLATNVGGIPEIVSEPSFGNLLPPGDAAALAAAMSEVLDNPTTAWARARTLRDSVARRFTVAGMAEAITAFYGATPARSFRRAA